MSDLVKRIMAKDISKNLYADNAFIKRSINDDDKVNNGYVDLAHAGNKPKTKLNRTEKGVATKRPDADSSYKLDEITTDPTWITYSEEMVTNYSKRSTATDDHKETINEDVGSYVASRWADNPLTKTIRTTGTVRASGLGTGNRRAITKKNVQAVATEMNKRNIPQSGRCALISAEELDDLLNIPEVANSQFNNAKPLVEGTIGRWMGFDWYVRSQTLRYKADGTLLPFGTDEAEFADTDCAGALFWHEKKVRKAQGDTKVFLNIGDAELYGDKLSALQRFGAKQARKDGYGVVVLIEGSEG